MKILKSTIRLVIVTAMSVVLAVGQDRVEAFDKYVEAARVDWNVPGMSVVVVRDGKILLSKGYGKRELGKADAVDNETLFGVMSTTKAMVAVAMGVLVDEGKIDWDDDVVEYLPDFRVADPYVTSELTIRDLFTHNGGMGNTDFLWARGSEITSAEIVRRMQYARPAYSLRSGFVYQNVMYLVAGQVIEKVSGMPWEQFMTTRVFGPLGMKNTFPNIGTSSKYQNRSSAHFEIKKEIKVIPEMSADSIGPAGAVWSTSDDMGKWVSFLLGQPMAGSAPLLKPATMSEIFKPQVILPSGFYPTFRLTKPKWTTYGLGWFQHDYRGEMVNFHTGSLAGRTAIVGLLRDKKVGIYIFGNLDHAEARHALMYKAFDVFGFDDNTRDWSAEMKTLYAGIQAEAEKQTAAQMSRRLQNTKPSLPLASYAGSYSDPFAGTMTVDLVDGKLRLTVAKDLTASLEHRQVDTFHAVWSKAWMGEQLLTFNLNPVSGDVVSISIAGQTLRRQARPAQ